MARSSKLISNEAVYFASYAAGCYSASIVGTSTSLSSQDPSISLERGRTIDEVDRKASMLKKTNLKPSLSRKVRTLSWTPRVQHESGTIATICC